MPLRDVRTIRRQHGVFAHAQRIWMEKHCVEPLDAVIAVLRRSPDVDDQALICVVDDGEAPVARTRDREHRGQDASVNTSPPPTSMLPTASPCSRTIPPRQL